MIKTITLISAFTFITIASFAQKADTLNSPTRKVSITLTLYSWQKIFSSWNTANTDLPKNLDLTIGELSKFHEADSAMESISVQIKAQMVIPKQQKDTTKQK